MKTLNISSLDFSDVPPKESGKYLYKDTLGVISIITVIFEPACSEFGMWWDSYYSVLEYGGKNVKSLKGSFIKIVNE